MNKHFVLALVALGIAAVSFHRPAEAQQPLEGEEYIVWDSTGSSSTQLGRKLDELGKIGWKVRCSTGPFVILAKERRI